MLTIAVCDDERFFVEELTNKIKNYISGCEVQSFCSGTELLRCEKRFDIYFLDIKMSEMDGIKTAKQIRRKQKDCIIIFVTSEKEYVFDAFDVSAFHYLVKPVDEKKLYEVLNRAKNEMVRRHEKMDRKMTVKIRDKNVVLDFEKVFYFESNIRKISTHTTSGEVEFYGVMTDVENLTGNNFFRCHRGYLVNLSYVTEYDKESVTLTNGDTVYLSKARYRDFVKTYMNYLRNGGGADA